jgi:hypothetical protein
MLMMGILAIVAVSGAFLGLVLMTGAKSEKFRKELSETNAKERMKANGLTP